MTLVILENLCETKEFPPHRARGQLPRELPAHPASYPAGGLSLSTGEAGALWGVRPLAGLALPYVAWRQKQWAAQGGGRGVLPAARARPCCWCEPCTLREARPRVRCRLTFLQAATHTAPAARERLTHTDCPRSARGVGEGWGLREPRGYPWDSSSDPVRAGSRHASCGEQMGWGPGSTLPSSLLGAERWVPVGFGPGGRRFPFCSL